MPPVFPSGAPNTIPNHPSEPVKFRLSTWHGNLSGSVWGRGGQRGFRSSINRPFKSVQDIFFPSSRAGIPDLITLGPWIGISPNVAGMAGSVVLQHHEVNHKCQTGRIVAPSCQGSMDKYVDIATPAFPVASKQKSHHHEGSSQGLALAALAASASSFFFFFRDFSKALRYCEWSWIGMATIPISIL